MEGIVIVVINDAWHAELNWNGSRRLLRCCPCDGFHRAPVLRLSRTAELVFWQTAHRGVHSSAGDLRVDCGVSHSLHLNCADFNCPSHQLRGRQLRRLFLQLRRQLNNFIFTPDQSFGSRKDILGKLSIADLRAPALSSHCKVLTVQRSEIPSFFFFFRFKVFAVGEPRSTVWTDRSFPLLKLPDPRCLLAFIGALAHLTANVERTWLHKFKIEHFLTTVHWSRTSQCVGHCYG